MRASKQQIDFEVRKGLISALSWGVSFPSSAVGKPLIEGAENVVLYKYFLERRL